MLIKEIKEKNDVILEKALYINELLTKINLNKDITECDNGRIYYTITSSLTAQKKAPMGEKFLCNKLGFKRIAASADCGDAIDQNGKYYEFKNSFTNQDENLNIRQIRLWQPVDYYYCFYINEKELEKSVFFILTKQQMEEEVALCGGYTHGTIAANSANKNREYSITIPVYRDNNEKTKRWKEKYLSLELKERILK